MMPARSRSDALERLAIRAGLRARATRLRGLIVGLAALSAPLLSGCEINPATGEQAFTAFMSPAEERRIGRQQDPNLRKAFGGAYRDKSLQAWVNRVGQRLAAHTGLEGVAGSLKPEEYSFTVLDSQMVNAFALPGGYVYVTRGLVSLARSEAELAGVLAHEIGHVTARHAAQRYSQTIVAGVGAAILSAVIGSKEATDLVGLGANLYLKGFSRENEFEADRLGIEYLSAAGYEPDAMRTFLTRLRRHGALETRLAGGKADPDRYDLFATHPRTIDRVERAAAAASITRVPNPRVGRDTFLERVDGLVWGESNQQGLTRGRLFVHPVLDFRIEMPPEFRVVNRPNAILAIGPRRELIVLDGAPKKAGTSPIRYLRSVLARELPFRNIERVSVNGMEAATGIARVPAKRGFYDIRVVIIRQRPDRMYRLIFVTRPAETRRNDVAFRRATYSFNRVSEQDRAVAREWRLSVERAQPGDTVRSLTRGFPPEAHAGPRLRVLNDIPDGGEPTPGQVLKVIVP